MIQTPQASSGVLYGLALWAGPVFHAHLPHLAGLFLQDTHPSKALVYVREIVEAFQLADVCTPETLTEASDVRNAQQRAGSGASPCYAHFCGRLRLKPRHQFIIHIVWGNTRRKTISESFKKLDWRDRLRNE